MNGRHEARYGVVAGMALIASLLTGPSGPATAATPNCPVKQESTSGLTAHDHPVVLVHGWIGEPLRETRAALARRLGKGWTALVYDYSEVNDHWAARPEIAACLSVYLRTVSKVHRDHGGDGRVYLVGHSMGGLALSYAVADAVRHDQDFADKVGGLVTLDTPWMGAPWGDTNWARLLQAKAHWRWPGEGSDAWTCLRKVSAGGKGGCSTPSYLPRSVRVEEIAGEVTIRRSFFGFHGYDIPLGSDAIVSSPSQHGYLGSAPGDRRGLHTTLRTVKCAVALDDLRGAGDAAVGGLGGGPLGAVVGGLVGTERQLLADGRAMDAIAADRASADLLEFLGAAIEFSPCSHTKITSSPEALDLVAQALREQSRPQPLTVTDLLHAPIPATCQHEAGRLVGGELPLKSEQQGFAGVLQGDDQRKFLVPPVLGDVDGDGSKELVGVLLCSAGGVSWPQVLLVYDAGVKLQAWLDLGDITPKEHCDVSSLKVVPQGVRVSWRAYEGAGFDITEHTATFRWKGDRAQVEGLTTIPVGPELEEPGD